MDALDRDSENLEPTKLHPVSTITTRDEKEPKAASPFDCRPCACHVAEKNGAGPGWQLLADTHDIDDKITLDMMPGFKVLIALHIRSE